MYYRSWDVICRKLSSAVQDVRGLNNIGFARLPLMQIIIWFNHDCLFLCGLQCAMFCDCMSVWRPQKSFVLAHKKVPKHWNSSVTRNTEVTAGLCHKPERTSCSCSQTKWLVWKWYWNSITHWSEPKLNFIKCHVFFNFCKCVHNLFYVEEEFMTQVSVCRCWIVLYFFGIQKSFSLKVCLKMIDRKSVV